MWKITNKSENEAEILLYDQISSFRDEDWGYINAHALIDEIKSLGNIKNIVLRINSVGGDLTEAIAMYHYLKSHPASVIVRIDSLAASAASIVAMAGNKIIMPANTLIMIHNPSSFVWGEAKDMKKEAAVLDIYRDISANIYSEKTGLDREKIISLMDDETWLTANEAHELKFCDEVEEAVEITAMAVKNGIIFKNGFGFARVDENLSAKFPKNTVNIKAKKTVEDTPKEEKTEMDIKNVADLEREFPELVTEIRNTAVNTERERLKTLDSLNAQGREAVIAKAKYEEPKDARDVAIAILQADQTQAQLNALYQDAGAVNGALPPQKDIPADEADKEVAMNAVVNEIKRMRGYR